MEKLSRINKYADLRNSLENSREGTNDSKELEKFAETLNNIDENNFSKPNPFDTNEITNKIDEMPSFLDEPKEELKIDTNPLDSLNFDTDDFLSNFLKEIEEINVSNGRKTAEDTQNQILDEIRGYTKEEPIVEPKVDLEPIKEEAETVEEDDSKDIAEEVQRIINNAEPFQPEATPIVPIIDDVPFEVVEPTVEPIKETEISDTTETASEESVDVSSDIEDTVLDERDLAPLNNDVSNNNESEVIDEPTSLEDSDNINDETVVEPVSNNVEPIEDEPLVTNDEVENTIENKIVSDEIVNDISSEELVLDTEEQVTSNPDEASFEDTKDPTLLNETLPIVLDEIKTTSNTAVYEDKPNVILNIVLVILILILVAVLVVIGYWILNIKGII